MAVERTPLGEIVKKLDDKMSLETRSTLKCLKCGHTENSRGKGTPYRDNNRILDSHIFSRKYLLLRWHPWNNIELCFLCERWWHKDIQRANDWIKTVIGERRFFILKSIYELSVEMDLVYEKGEHQFKKECEEK